MNYNLTPLFSIPLFQTNIGSVDAITKAWIMNLNFPDYQTGHDFTDDHLKINDKGMHILDKPQLNNLKTRIKKVVNYFVHELLGVEDYIDFQIETSWINRNKKDEFITRHVHAGAMLSGVYYIETNENTAPIMFERSFSYTNLFHDTVKPDFKIGSENQFNKEIYTIQPNIGDLLIFPSHLEHTVPKSKTDFDRYSLAFNCFARGEIGEATRKIKL
jgi:uncharacterized protein (TIGR02466 family)